MNFLKKIKTAFNAKLQNRLQDKRFLYMIRKELLDEKTLNDTNKGVSPQHYLDAELIVSLTSYGKRIQTVSTTIESIMQGSIKPNRIVLWLDKNPEITDLPITLEKQKKRGLEIYFTDENIRSYTKLIPTLRMFPNAYIITIDDDAIYDYNLVENLLKESKKFPKHIIANRVHQILLDKKGNILPYQKWLWEKTMNPISSRNFLTGVGGVIYPPNCFDSEIFNKNVFCDICKYADDIWFFAMALKNGVPIKKADVATSSGLMYLLNENVQDIGLCNTNVLANQNDIQLKSVLSKYNLYNRLKCEEHTHSMLAEDLHRKKPSI